MVTLQGDYSKHSLYWTKDLLAEVKPDFSAASLWLSFAELSKAFKYVNVSKVTNMPEIRIKGEFVK